jgi:hypothetical protein
MPGWTSDHRPVEECLPMNASRVSRIATCGVLLLASGCTSLREIPRSEYASQTQRKDVRIRTVDGLVYEFDYVQVERDSLTGFRSRDVEGAFVDLASHRVALEDIEHLSTRGVDWYRTGLVGSGALAAVIAAGLGAAGRSKNDQPTSGGGKPIWP